MKHRTASSRGSALFLVLILAVVMGSVMAALLSYTSHASRIEKRSDIRLEGVYAAEYAFETARQHLLSLVSQDSATLPTIAQTTAATNLGTAPSDVFTTAQGYAWRAFLTLPIQDGVVVPAHTAYSPSHGSYKFLTTVEFLRDLPTQAPVHLHFQREFTYVLTPLFQYAIFYDGDMELFPGANFVVSGRVHANGRIHVGTSASITFSDRVSHVNGLTNSYSSLDPRAPGSPGANITYTRGPAIVTTREDPPGALARNTSDLNPNNDGPRELIEIADLLHPDPESADRLYDKAGLKVLANTATDARSAPNGVSVPAGSRLFFTRDGTPIPATDSLSLHLAASFATGSMTDYRESASVVTTDLNVSALNASYQAGGLPQNIPASETWPNNATVPAALRGQAIPSALRGKALWNGILYVADVSADASRRAAVRVLNGTSLPDGSQTTSPTAGLTIVSSNPAYIVGDYNTGGSPPVNSGSNLAADNHVASYTVQPAAIIADAVTVVSSNWISGNYNAVASLSSRAPVNTTLNAALISGVVPSNGSAYSGGVENYIRLLENWSGRRLTYYGSIVNMYESRHATAPWRNTGIYYNAPTRNWYFDVNFLDPRKLPPGSPVARSLKRGQWVQLR